MGFYLVKCLLRAGYYRFRVRIRVWLRSYLCYFPLSTCYVST